jgi:hypothetical protein
MRVGEQRFETHHLTCMVCGALPGTTCLDGDQERAEIHPSRRMSIAERNWRSGRGWEPPELVGRHRKQRREEAARAALFDPRLGPGTVVAPKRRKVKGRAAS